LTRTSIADLARRVVARWLERSRSLPAAAHRKARLPVALVSSLRRGDRVVGMDGAVYVVEEAGPGALVLGRPGGPSLAFTNRGHASYSWAYYTAPVLHWLM
jgi:hypothetical protein